MRACTHVHACAFVRTHEYTRERGRRERSVYRLRSVTSRAHMLKRLKDFLPDSLVPSKVPGRSGSSSSFSGPFSEKRETDALLTSSKFAVDEKFFALFRTIYSIAYSPTWPSLATLAPPARLRDPNRIRTSRLRTCKPQTGLCQYTARQSLWIDIEHARREISTRLISSGDAALLGNGDLCMCVRARARKRPSSTSLCIFLCTQFAESLRGGGGILNSREPLFPERRSHAWHDSYGFENRMKEVS